MGHGTIEPCIIESLRVSFCRSVPPRYNSPSPVTLRESHCSEYGPPRSTGNSLGVSLRDSSGSGIFRFLRFETLSSRNFKPHWSEPGSTYMESFRLPSFEYHRVRTILCVLFITKTYENKTVQDWMLPFSPSTPLHQECYIARWFLERFRPPPHHYGQTCQCFYDNHPHI